MANRPVEVAFFLALASSIVHENQSRTSMQGHDAEPPLEVRTDMDRGGSGGSIRLHRHQHLCKIQRAFPQGHRNTSGERGK